MKKPERNPELETDHCDYSAPGSPGIRAALDGLAHFHVKHSNNQDTADVFMTKDAEVGRVVLVMVISDPAILKAVTDAVRRAGFEMLPEPPPGSVN